MTAICLEIRDSGTFIPVMAIKLNPDCEENRYLIARSGFGSSPLDQARYVLLIRIGGGSGAAHCDPYDWGTQSRTMCVAHKYIIDNFDSLNPGDVIDVEFILGEKTEKKRSERFYEY